VNSKKEGKGRYIWPDGNRYFGTWHDNAIDGVGVYIWADGRVYYGDW
jgi:1-phosphatidylinositol-4-phosphate 5-kinase